MPEPVSSLSMRPVGRTLSASWTPPSGDWEKYSVILRNGSIVLLNETISKLKRKLILNLALVPGRLYRAEVVVHSGGLRKSAYCHGSLREFKKALTETLDLMCMNQNLVITDKNTVYFNMIH